MTTTVDAIYEHGKLVLPRPLSLPEKSHVRVTIETDPEREAWLKLSEESLTRCVGNSRTRPTRHRDGRRSQPDSRSGGAAAAVRSQRGEVTGLVFFQRAA